ncbi:Hypothetical predicted protein, partial [Paramuricea clavata]
KAAKRLYIIRTLKRSGMTADDLLTIYIALIRSVLEYCCPAQFEESFENNLPKFIIQRAGPFLRIFTEEDSNGRWWRNEKGTFFWGGGYCAQRTWSATSRLLLVLIFNLCSYAGYVFSLEAGYNQ